MLKSLLLLFFIGFILMGAVTVDASDQKSTDVFVLKPDDDKWTMARSCIPFLPVLEIAGPQADKLRNGLRQLDKNAESRDDAYGNHSPPPLDFFKKTKKVRDK